MIVELLCFGVWRESKPLIAHDLDGESAGARTQDQRLKRAMLYQLSYALKPHYQVSTFGRGNFAAKHRQYNPLQANPICRATFATESTIRNGYPGFMRLSPISTARSHLSRTTVSLTWGTPQSSL